MTAAPLSMAKLSAAILGLVVVCTPLVGYVWEVLNDLLSGRFNGLRAAIALPVSAILALVLRIMARLVGRLDAAQGHHGRVSEEPTP